MMLIITGISSPFFLSAKKNKATICSLNTYTLILLIVLTVDGQPSWELEFVSFSAYFNLKVPHPLLPESNNVMMLHE